MMILSTIILVLFRFASNLIPYVDASEAIVQFLHLLFPELPEVSGKRLIQFFLLTFLISFCSPQIGAYVSQCSLEGTVHATAPPPVLSSPTAVPVWVERYLPIIPPQELTPDTIYTNSISWLEFCLRSVYGCDIQVDGCWDDNTTECLQLFKSGFGFGYEPPNTLTYDMAYSLLNLYLELGFILEDLAPYCRR